MIRNKEKIENGYRFGILTVIGEGSKIKRTSSSIHKYKILCHCDCGNQIELLPCQVRGNRRTSCGCLGNHRKGKEARYWSGYEEISGCYWGRVKAGAKKRGLEFCLTMKDVQDLFIEQGRKCALTGIPLVMCSSVRKKEQTASLDRIDNSKGYIKGNVWWVHKDINMMKNNMNLNYFVNLCKNVAKNFGSYESVLTLNIFNDLQTLIEKYREVPINEKV